MRNRKSKSRNRKSEIRTAEFRNQKWEIENHWCDVVCYVISTHNAFYPTILSCMWRGGRGRGGEGDDRVGGLSNRAISSLWGKRAGKGS